MIDYMMRKKVALISILVLWIVALPACAFAWGPLTHMYLGTEVFYLGSLLPAGIYRLIKKFRQDFLYGNLMADTVLAKKYMDDEGHSHSWETGFRLLDSAETDAERAFCYGYLSHLAADTVAHGKFTHGDRGLGHAFKEIRADSAVNPIHWLGAMAISRKVQRRGDDFLGRSIDPVIFTFSTNTTIFKSVVALSFLHTTPGRVLDMVEQGWVPAGSRKKKLAALHQKSLDRIVDVLANGRESRVVAEKDPVARIPKNKLFKALIEA